MLKQPYDATNHEKEFIKEARLLHSLLGNRNIVEFIVISSSPSFILMQDLASLNGSNEKATSSSIRANEELELNAMNSTILRFLHNIEN